MSEFLSILTSNANILLSLTSIPEGSKLFWINFSVANCFSSWRISGFKYDDMCSIKGVDSNEITSEYWLILTTSVVFWTPKIINDVINYLMTNYWTFWTVLFSNEQCQAVLYSAE